MSRRTARKHAFLTLYQSDVTGKPLGQTVARWREYRGDLEDYAVRLARGVEKEKETLDGILSDVSEGWPVHRMSAVDRSILRLGLFEMIHSDDVPPEVAVGEAEGYIVPNGTVSVLSADGEVVSVEPPAHVDLEVAETDPGLKGDTATGGSKPAKLETGVVVQVPLFVNVGERIRVDTRTNEYLTRV